jgi:ATP-binding cassette subfamily C protein
MRLVLAFARAYPRHSLVMLVCLVLSATAEGLGYSTLLPVLGIATRGHGSAATSGEFERVVLEALGWVGIEPRLGPLLALVVGAMFLKGALMLVSQRQVGYTVAHVATDLRLSLLRALLSTRWSYYTRQPVGVLSNSFATEAYRAAEAYLHGTFILSLVLQTLVYSAVAVAVSWQVALGAFLLGALVLASLRSLVRMTRRAGVKQTRLMSALLGRLTDNLQAVKPLKAMARETLMGPMLEHDTQRLNRAMRRQVVSKEALKAIQEPLTFACLACGMYVLTVWWGMELGAVLVLGVLFGNTLASLSKVQRRYQHLVSYESAYWAIRETIEHAEAHREIPTGDRAPTLDREIALEEVDLDYEGQPVLRGVSISIPAGRITALIGPSGSGKTSILDLVIGLTQPRAGEVRVDGVSLREIDTRTWRSSIGYVPQEVFLLNGTVLLNVSLGDPGVSREQVEQALRRADAEFALALPEGIDTTVGERGSLLSGGQRQRIAIARALVKRPRLLILDEATTALDPDTEASLWKTLERLRGETTILAVSHQPRLAAEADRVYRVAEGTVQPVAREGEAARRSSAS